MISHHIPTKAYQNDWELINESKDSFFIAKILKDNNFKHGFFTRSSQGKTIKDLSINLGQNITIHEVNQIHSNLIIKAEQTNKRHVISADGITSHSPNQSLWIYTADCIPVLIANSKSGNVSACHVGWRGVKERITINAIKKLTNKDKGVNQIYVAMGPSISMKNYQVDLNTAQEIYRSLYNRKKLISLKVSAAIEKLHDLRIIDSDIEKNKVKLDIRLALQEQLINEGLSYKQISICPLCTFDNECLFFSRRREKDKKVQWSAIVSR